MDEAFEKVWDALESKGYKRPEHLYYRDRFFIYNTVGDDKEIIELLDSYGVPYLLPKKYVDGNEITDSMKLVPIIDTVNTKYKKFNTVNNELIGMKYVKFRGVDVPVKDLRQNILITKGMESNGGFGMYFTD